jgi:hypothetical protein
MSRHPSARVRFERNGRVLQTGDDVGSLEPLRAIGLLREKLLPLRAVDQQSPTRCREGFLPAG